jgi:hypothetical protein
MTKTMLAYAVYQARKAVNCKAKLESEPAAKER